MVTIDIDTGGTHTDGFLTCDGRWAVVKVETTPHDLTLCFQNCIAQGAIALEYASLRDMLRDTAVIRFSTTIGTNTLIQHRGPKLGLVVTRGREESLSRFLVSPDMVLGLAETMGGNGETRHPPRIEEVRTAVHTLLRKGARMIVVSLHDSWRGNDHERLVREMIYQDYPEHTLGAVPTLLSSEVSVRPEPVSRTATSLLNAYVHREMAQSLYKTDDWLRREGFSYPLLVVHADGGVARVSKTRAIDTLNSGPAAGAHGSSFWSKLYNLPRVISLDMGGTTTDLCVIDGHHVHHQFGAVLEGIPIDSPVVDIGGIGAGGGSIARVVPGEGLKVGPASAGALPGPASYGLGGVEPTTTDANLILGFLDPGYFLGGRRTLDPELAVSALETVARPLSCEVLEAARRVKARLEEDVGDAAREFAGARRLAPAESVLFAFGGGGGCHACGIAEAAGISTIYTFAVNPVFCAFGSSRMDVVHVYETGVELSLFEGSRWDSEKFNGPVARMQERGAIDMRGEGFSREALRFHLKLEIHGKDGEPVMIPAPVLHPEAGYPVEGPALAVLGDPREFVRSVREAGGIRDGVIRVLRLEASVSIPHFEPVAQDNAGADCAAARKGERRVLWPAGDRETPIFDHERLRCGNRIAGPAVIESPFTTYAVAPGWTFEMDRYGNGVFTRQVRS